MIVRNITAETARSFLADFRAAENSSYYTGSNVLDLLANQDIETLFFDIIEHWEKRKGEHLTEEDCLRLYGCKFVPSLAVKLSRNGNL